MIDWTSLVTILEPPAGIGAVVWLILRGKLRPQKQIDEIIQTFDDRVKTYKDLAADWKEAYQLEQKARMKQEDALRETLEVGRTSLDILKAIRKAADNK